MSPFDFIELIVFLCAKHHGSVGSWGRTPKHNVDVGGVANSYHMVWMGCDVVLDEMVKNQSFESDAIKLGLDPILEGDHYHLQPEGWR